MQRDIKDNVADPLEKAGVELSTFGTYLRLRRSAHERADMANPGLVRGKDAEKTLDAMRARFGEEKYDAIVKAADEFWKIRQRHVIPLLRKSRMFSDELMKIIENNDEYATYSVAKYFEAYRGGSDYNATIYRQLGTADEILNPFFATIHKDAALLFAAQSNYAKRTAAEELRKFDSAGIKDAETRYDERYKTHVPIEPKNQEVWGLLEYREDGKRVGVYVRREIADLFHHEAEAADLLFRCASLATGVLKGMFTTYNPGFGVWNLRRDFLTTLHNIPTANNLDEIILLPDLGYSYLKTLRSAYLNAFKKHSTPLMRELLESGLVVADRQWSAKDLTAISEYERMVAEWSLDNKKHKAFWKRMALAVFNDFNKMTESWGKLAGYEYMKRKGLVDVYDMREIMRGIVSTPDVLSRGTYTKWTNMIFLYSNVNVQGIGATYRAFKANPAKYILRRLAYSVIPTAIMLYLKFGIDDDDDDALKKYKGAFNAIPDYEKRMRHVFPVGWDGNKVDYIPLPLDYGGEIVHGALWSLFGEKNKSGAVASVLGASPMQPGNLNPLIQLGSAAFEYAIGQNPIDMFRMQPAIDEQIFAAGGFRSAKEFAKWMWNQTGGSTFGNFERPFQTKPKGAESLPIIKPVMRRFIRTAEKQDAAEPVDTVRAKTVVSAKDYISKALRGAHTEKDVSVRQLYTQWKTTTTLPKGYGFTDFKRLYDNLRDKKWPKQKAS